MTYSDTGLVRYKSTDRYYRTDQIRTEPIQIRDLSDTGVPVGTTGLVQRQNLSDTGVPVGTAEQIRYRT